MNPRQRFNEELDDAEGEGLRAVQGLVRLADAGAEPAREALARLAVKTIREPPLQAILEGVATAGPPKDPVLAAQLAKPRPEPRPCGGPGGAGPGAGRPHGPRRSSGASWGGSASASEAARGSSSCGSWAGAATRVRSGPRSRRRATS